MQEDRALGVHALALELYRRWQIGPIDLRFNHGRWCVMLGIGNQMMIIDGSEAATPEQALRNTIALWDGRSPERPFGFSPPHAGAEEG